MGAFFHSKKLDEETTMKMSGQLKVTTPKEYIAALKEPRRSEVVALETLVRKAAPKLEPFIYSGMLGFGPFHYKYASGREGDAAKIAIASNANYISLYLLAIDEKGYVAERYADQLPKAKVGKTCVRFKKLQDLDVKVLTALIKQTAKSGFAG